MRDRMRQFCERPSTASQFLHVDFSTLDYDALARRVRDYLDLQRRSTFELNELLSSYQTMRKSSGFLHPLLFWSCSYLNNNLFFYLEERLYICPISSGGWFHSMLLAALWSNKFGGARLSFSKALFMLAPKESLVFHYLSSGISVQSYSSQPILPQQKECRQALIFEALPEGIASFTNHNTGLLQI